MYVFGSHHQVYYISDLNISAFGTAPCQPAPPSSVRNNVYPRQPYLDGSLPFADPNTYYAFRTRVDADDTVRGCEEREDK